MTNAISRRAWLAQTTALAAGTAVRADDKKPINPEPFGYCLNTSTISGQKLDLVEVVEITAKAGYNAIEPWIRELEAYQKNGGNLKELGKRIADKGLKVESVIGFFEWIVDDDTRRAKALEVAKQNMELAQQIGGKRLAAPPVGATNQTDMNLLKAAERYRALCEIGDKIGVVPQVEVWGFSKTLGRLGDGMMVAAESGHPKACILADVYHLYKGGSQINGLRLLNGDAMHVLHFNDYPANPSRTDITDALRVYPGDGVAPLKEIVQMLRQINYQGVLSLELFNRDYWKQDALTVAKTGLEKMKAAVKAS